MVDTEGSHQWLRNEVVVWDPRTDPNELKFETDDTTVVVRANSMDPINQAYSWLIKGTHPFRSANVDSIMALQEKMKKSINSGPFEQRDWGTLLDRLDSLILLFTDLTEHPTNPLDSVIFTAGAALSDKTGKIAPYLQGQISMKLPYKVSVVGYLAQTTEGNPYLVIQPVGDFSAKDRTGYLSEHYGPSIKANASGKLDLAEIMAVLNKEKS